MPLNARQQAFVAAYEGNATDAARKAGYSKATAESIGSRLLRNVKVAEAIEARRAKAVQSLIATREERQAFWTASLRNVEASLADRLRASELLGKAEADFTEKVQHSGHVELVDPYARPAE